jgi:hypothetical protein
MGKEKFGKGEKRKKKKKTSRVALGPKWKIWCYILRGNTAAVAQGSRGLWKTGRWKMPGEDTI